jgi:hypothetical protein
MNTPVTPLVHIIERDGDKLFVANDRFPERIAIPIEIWGLMADVVGLPFLTVKVHNGYARYVFDHWDGRATWVGDLEESSIGLRHPINEKDFVKALEKGLA